MKSKQNTTQQFHTKAMVLALTACFAQPVFANPVGPTIVSGNATFANAGNTLTVTNTPGAILNWQQFNIAQGQTTQFIQQSAQSSVLNRVISNNPSLIYGTLRSNGNVFLINQSGILFGKGSVLDVNSLIASSMNISNADFTQGKLNFAGPAGTGVTNQGTISTPSGGRVYLIGTDVSNQGVISTPQGETILAAGNSVSLVDTGSPHVTVTLSAPAGGNAVNIGKILAQDGSINIYGSIIKQQGLISADSASIDALGNVVLSATQSIDLAAGSITSANGANNGGNISIDSGTAGTTTVSGAVSATGGSGVGGSLNILGNNVGLFAGAKVSVSGDTGGGSAFIGGNFHGAGVLHNASQAVVAQGANINADAITTGNGGNVAVWSDNWTRFYGSISARGGSHSGNGGFVETSGKQTLSYVGLVDTSAPHGTAGTLLLDPTDITISTAQDATSMINSAGTFADVIASASNLNTTTLQNQLALSNVIVDTTSGLRGVGNLTVQSSLAWASAYGLTLKATGAGNIVVNSLDLLSAPLTISNTGAGGLTMTTANGYINLAGGISLANGAFGANAGGTNGYISIAAPLSTGAGAITLNSGSFISEATGGSITAGSLTTSAMSGTSLIGGATPSQGTSLSGNFVSSFSATDNALIVFGNTAPILTLGRITSGGYLALNNTGLIYANSITSSGNIALNSNSSASGLTMVPGGIEVMGAISTKGGNITLNGNSTSSVGQSLGLGLGGLMGAGSNWVYVFAPVSTHGGSLYINTPGDVWMYGGSSCTALGACTTAGVVTNGGNVNIAANSFMLGYPGYTIPATGTGGVAIVYPGTPGIIDTSSLTGGGNVTINTNGLISPLSHYGLNGFSGNGATFLSGSSLQSVSLLSGSTVNLGTTGNMVINGVTDPARGSGATPYTATSNWAPNLTGANPISSLAGNYAGTDTTTYSYNYLTPNPTPTTGTNGNWTMSISSTGAVNLSTSGVNNIPVSGQVYSLPGGLMEGFATGVSGTNSTGTFWVAKVDQNTGALSGAWETIQYSSATLTTGLLANLSYGTFASTSNPSRSQITDICLLNPTQCAATSQPPVQPKPVVDPQASATGNLYLSTGMGAVSGALTWISYSDIRTSRQDARAHEAEADEADKKVKEARNPEEKAAARHYAEAVRANADLKRADANIRQSEAELRAANSEVNAARTPQERIRSETRKAIAETKRADADVQKADAEVRAVLAEAKRGGDTGNKANAEARISQAMEKKSGAEVKHADAAAKQADVAAQQAKDEAKSANTPEAHTNAEVKVAAAEVAKAEAAEKHAAHESATAKDPAARSNAEVKLAEASVKKANAEARQAQAEAKQADEAAQNSDTPGAHAVAQAKHEEVNVKSADAEVKAARLESKTAKDPAAKTAAEDKVVSSEAKHARAEEGLAKAKVEKAEAAEGKDSHSHAVENARAEHEEKHAHAEVKEAEVEVHHAKDPEARSHAEGKLAETHARHAETEEKVASHEAREAKEALSKATNPIDREVAQKKVEAAEAKVEAKHIEVAAKHAKVELKRAEAEAQQAKTPEEHAAAEKHIAEKRAEVNSLESKAESLKDDVAQKEETYKAYKGQRDEKVIESFGGVDLAGSARGQLQQVMVSRHEFMKENMAPALNILKANPHAADVKTCGSGSGDTCIRPLAQATTRFAEIQARIQMPVMQPKLSFLPVIQRKVAVVIGNNAYQDPKIPTLTGAINDADAVGEVMKTKLGYDVQMVHNGTRADIIRQLNKIADETGSNDSVVVYYAGHGYEMEDTGIGYWIPSDASTKNPSNWISGTDINAMLSNIPAKQVILVSDSCFSGALTKEQKVSTSSVAGQSAQDILGKRTVTVMSSGGDEPVVDEGKEGHSIFAWHLIDKLNKVEQFQGGTGIFDAVKKGVADEGIEQQPQYGASISAGHTAGGDYLFEVRKY